MCEHLILLSIEQIYVYHKQRPLLFQMLYNQQSPVYLTSNYYIIILQIACMTPFVCVKTELTIVTSVRLFPIYTRPATTCNFKVLILYYFWSQFCQFLIQQVSKTYVKYIENLKSVKKWPKNETVFSIFSIGPTLGTTFWWVILEQFTIS